MYLGALTFNEKIAFYELAKSIIASDNIIAEEEKYLLDQFLGEMGITKEQTVEMSFETALDTIAHSTRAEKKKIFIELVALAMCDNDFATEERQQLDTIAKTFGFSEPEHEEMQALVFELLDVYKRMNAFIAE